jgi:hypothetical protein
VNWKHNKYAQANSITSFSIQSCTIITNEGVTMEILSQYCTNFSRDYYETTIREEKVKRKEQHEMPNVLLCKCREFDAFPQHISTIQSNFLVIIPGRKR